MGVMPPVRDGGDAAGFFSHFAGGLAVFYQSLDLLCDSLAVCGK
jgi:hypothetical protein